MTDDDDDSAPGLDRAGRIVGGKNLPGGAGRDFKVSAFSRVGSGETPGEHDQGGNAPTIQPRTIAAYEAKRATGFTSDGSGKRIAADGLVSRGGYRRIIPGETTEEENKREWRAEELATIAAEIFSGRNATIFEGRILNPLMGRPKRSVEDLAAQFGIPTQRVYKIEERCRERVMAAFSTPSRKMDHKGFVAAAGQLQKWAESERCSLCGRCLAPTPLPACRGAFANEDFDDFRPECLRIQYRTEEFKMRLAALEAAHQQWFETEGRLRENARWRAEYEATKAELAALGRI
jgi:hypothetical protein